MTERRPAEESDERGERGTPFDASERERARAEREVLHAGMDAVWERFGGVVEERVHALEAFVAKARTGAATPADVRAAHAVAHKLMGSLGTFGFPEGSKVAREVQALLAERDEIPDSDVTALGASVAALRAAVSLPRSTRQA